MEEEICLHRVGIPAHVFFIPEVYLGVLHSNINQSWAMNLDIGTEANREKIIHDLYIGIDNAEGEGVS